MELDVTATVLNDVRKKWIMKRLRLWILFIWNNEAFPGILAWIFNLKEIKSSSYTQYECNKLLSAGMLIISFLYTAHSISSSSGIQSAFYVALKTISYLQLFSGLIKWSHLHIYISKIFFKETFMYCNKIKRIKRGFMKYPRKCRFLLINRTHFSLHTARKRFL